MRRGGIQDRIKYQDPITVGTDPEEPLMVKDLRYYWSNAQRICWTEKRHVEELRRLLVQCEETCSKLADWHKVFIDSNAAWCFSAAFLGTLIDSYDRSFSDADAIRHALGQKPHHHYTVDLIVRAQYDLDVAAEQVAFVEDLHKVMHWQRRAVARIEPIWKDMIT